MFSNTKEVEYSLDEFAKALAASGYMYDESYLADDIPSMLNAFETAEGFENSSGFFDIQYNNGDLHRGLEMNNISNPSVLETTETNSYSFAKLSQDSTSGDDGHQNKTRESIVNAILNELQQNANSSTSCKDGSDLKDVFLDYHNRDTNLSLHFKTDYIKENKDVTTGEFYAPLHFPVSNIEDSGCRKEVLLHTDNVYHPTGILHQSSTSQTRHKENDAKTIHDNSDSVQSRTKQKRKRRSKGYSKPVKSKKRKNLSEIQSVPKPKKQKISHSSAKRESLTKEAKHSYLYSSKTPPQEDSGFESGEKNSCELSESLSEKLSDSISGNSLMNEELQYTEPMRVLRRSSRTTRNPENYNFRLSSLVKRVETERRQMEPRQPKDKTKPPPLSKYRRRTANARERDRMKEINEAFDKLKDSLPSIQRDDGKQKITKFTILKHALNYIASLRDILDLDTTQGSMDDDISSDLSSIRPASVTSSGGEDSCSSSSSSHSTINHLTMNHGSASTIVDPRRNLGLAQANDLPGSIPLRCTV